MPSSISCFSDKEDVFCAIVEQLTVTGYSVLANALPVDMQIALLNTYQQQNPREFSPAGIGRLSDFTQNRAIRGDKILWIEGSSDAGRAWLQWCEALRQYLNRHLFLGLFSFESHFARYDNGAFYKRHYDAFAGGSNRKLSLVTYLNQHWTDDAGGELVLYKDDNDHTGIIIPPQSGTLVLFLSEVFPHEVKPAKKERISIAGWFRVNGSDTSRVDPPS